MGNGTYVFTHTLVAMVVISGGSKGGAPPHGQNLFSISCSFGKCWRPLEGWRNLLRGIRPWWFPCFHSQVGCHGNDSLVFTHRLVAMAMISLFSLTGWLPWQWFPCFHSQVGCHGNDSLVFTHRLHLKPEFDCFVDAFLFMTRNLPATDLFFPLSQGTIKPR